MDVLSRQARFAPPTTEARIPIGVGPAGADWLSAALVASATCGAAVWIAIQLLRRDEGLGTPAYDQAFFQQVIWNLDSGRGFVSSFSEGSFLGLHFSPLVVVPAALELVWPDPRMLTLINAASVALAAPAAFLFLRATFSPSRLGVYLAAGLAIALPFTPVMQEAARAGFHTETMAFPAVLVAGWAGLTRRWALMWGSAAVPLLAKEDQVYAVAVIGLLIAIRGRPGMRRHGFSLATVAVVWGVALFAVVMPALRGGVPLQTGNYYSWLATFPEPSAVWAQLSNREGWAAAAGLIACFGCLPLLRPRWMLVVLPPLVANLVSRHHPQPELQLQYGLLLVTPAMVAAAMGGRRALVLAERFPWRGYMKRLQAAHRLAPAFLVAAVPGLLLGVSLGSLPPAGLASAAFERQPGLSRLMSITAIIPPGAAVAADNDAAAPLASRATIYVLPSLRPDCYVVIDRVASVQSFMTPDEREALLAGVRANRRLLADDGRFQMWSPAGG